VDRLNVDAYLHRIGARRGDSLAALHEAHVRSVPFEDYDIHLGIPIDLRLDALQDKIVRRRRGGFCYELNGLFAAMLRELGHDVTLVSAFALGPDRTPQADFEHACLLVDDAWIADVGNGAGWLHPVPLAPGVSVNGGAEVEIGRDGDLWWSRERRPGREWEDGWAWRPTPRRLEEFLPRCRYQEHDPGSHFVARRLAVLTVPGGRLALVNGLLSETGRPDRELEPAQERTVLAERFGLTLPDRPWR